MTDGMPLLEKIEEKFQKVNVPYFASETENGMKFLVVNIAPEGTPCVQVRFIKDDNNPFVHVVAIIWNTVPREYTVDMLLTMNQLTQTCVYLGFYLDPDNNLCAKYDISPVMANPEDMALDVLNALLHIIPAAFPKLSQIASKGDNVSDILLSAQAVKMIYQKNCTE